MFLNFDFKGVYFIKNWPILKEIDPLLVQACVTCQCRSRLKIKNPLSHDCLPLSNAFQNDNLVAPTTTEEIDFREKDWMQAQC